jgi:hypothetical protein
MVENVKLVQGVERSRELKVLTPENKINARDGWKAQDKEKLKQYAKVHTQNYRARQLEKVLE